METTAAHTISKRYHLGSST